MISPLNCTFLGAILLVFGSVNGIERKWYLGKTEHWTDSSLQVLRWFHDINTSKLCAAQGKSFRVTFLLQNVDLAVVTYHYRISSKWNLGKFLPKVHSINSKQKKTSHFSRVYKSPDFDAAECKKQWWRWKIFRKAFNPFDQLAARPKSSSTTQIEVLTSTTLEAWFVPSLEVAMKRFVWSHSRWWVVDVPAF